MLEKVWINKNFCLLWTGKLVSELGDNFYAIAMAWWILEKSKSPSIMGIYLAASMLPGLIIGIAAGAYIDRLNHKTVIIAADIIRGVIILGVTGLFVWGKLEIMHVMLAAVIGSLCSAFFNPTVLAVVPGLVDQEVIAKANAKMQLIDGLSAVAGPVSGALAVSVLGFGWVFGLNGLSYLLSAFSECFIKINAKQNAAGKNTILEDIREGMRFLRERRDVLIVIMIIGIAHLFVGTLSICMPFVANQLSGNGIQNLGYLQMVLGLGFIAGSFYAGSKKSPRHKLPFLLLLMMMIGICFIAAGNLLFFDVFHLLPYLFILFVIGLIIVNASVYWQTLLQLNTPEHIRGRVFSISSLAGDASLPISFLIFGYLLHRIPVHYLLMINGAGLLIISCIILYYSHKVSLIELEHDN